MYGYKEKQLIISEEDILKGIKDARKALKRLRSENGLPTKEHTSKEGKRYLSYLKRANSKKIDFLISEEVFSNIILLECAYCGKEKAGGIDRIDNRKGYIKENCAPCCSVCNMMKYTHSKEFFISHAIKIVNNITKNKLVSPVSE